ncbi:ABC-F family ATP-binding cassette domain-containing protein [Adhaeribacter soli]|uniref:ABC-F family ATP-binding cassette domain-containing protein n=1 Tax=Adhaeribacter soli TaxID=2607655 RepID=A0A5N1IPC3_9BACT|nr:ABC-F family ATP-binding cassette domain-containing protein [Adhaeribacter soli]KAA9325601.1 ABC-F family ATP-binding cassette domain-containing protein [Adhaeribacter soli]
MLILQSISYTHPNKDLLFSNIDLNLNKYQKAALIGNNGAGKSTLLKLITGTFQPANGSVFTSSKPYYIPQIFGQFNHLTVAQALQVEAKLKAFKEILNGEANEENLLILDDDWTIEDRCFAALAYWKLQNLDLHQKMETLSGGQKTKVFLAGIAIHQPEIILLDEPSNHLDAESRQLLYDFIQHTSATLLVVSHDRKLLNLLDSVYELSWHGIKMYSGNYEFYAEQKQLETNALNLDIKSKERALRQAKEVARETLERQQKLDALGKKKQEKAGMPTIVMNTLRNNAEKSTARIKDVHAEKTDNLAQELTQLRQERSATDKMKFGFDNAALHKGKILFAAKDLNFGYGAKMLWEQHLTISLTSGERIAVKGANGSGKTTLIKLILGELKPQNGMVQRAGTQAVYIDQDYSLIDNQLTVYEQAQKFNATSLLEHEIKIRLNRFLFAKDYWDKPCAALSGGEKMRLALCCLTIANKAPDMIILDEPTNNLDIQNIEILTAAINEYEGTLLVISHDAVFLEQIGVSGEICLE